MTTSLRRGLGWVAALMGLMVLSGSEGRAQEPATADPAAQQEARDALAMKRFLSLLEKNPRKGTALDRVYGYHVERGTLDGFLKELRDHLAKKPTDGAGWMILGLLEFQRGQDALAAAALKKAQETRPDDPLPSYYLGQALLLVGQPDQGAAAFEQALAKKPTRSDLLEIFQALGRVYERTQKFDQALKVWNRLEALFPSDLTVQEQIARTLAEEGRPESALPRYEALAKKLSDPFRQIELAMQAADLKVKLGKKDDALRDFETLLGKLRPDSWLYREARSKIEDVFLRNDDQPGLVAYYEAWIKKEPEDVDALLRIGRTLASMGRASEAQAWYQKAVTLAPSRREIRLALISQLASDGRFDQAAAQYEALDKAEPNNPDTLRDWGSLVLRDTTKTPPERKAAAAAVWKRMLESKPKDPTAAAGVADLLRQAELVDDALALYKKAIELAGDNPQYHEYLGEYLHQLKRPQEALAAWAQIAAPPHATAKNLARLAEVLAGFGYVKEAAEPMTKAVALEGDSFDYRLKLAEILHRLERYDLADRELLAARGLALKDEEKTAVLDARVINDQSANRIPQRIQELSKAIKADSKPTLDQYLDLARYEEADGKLPEAVRTATKGVGLVPRSIPAWTLLARVQEAAGSLADAANALRKLGEIDRKNRAEYLTGVARLEQRLGRIQPALKAGRDLLEAAPGNPEHYEFFAQLCFQLGKSDEGLDALRRAVRVNPSDTKIILTLADNLATAFRSEEALEMYWRAYEKAPTLDEKVGVAAKLAEISILLGKFDRMLARLKNQDRQGSAEAQPRDVAICTAQAFTTAGDLGSARAELERLLASNARDPQILQQLAKLTEEESDFEAAARYQRQLAELVVSDENSAKLGELLMRAGEFDLAQAVWSKMASGKGEPRRVYAAIDHLLTSKKTDAALRAAEDLVRKNPADWEALYRQGVALADLKKPELAAQTFQRLLALTPSDDEKSAQAKSRVKDPSAAAASARPSAYAKLATMPLQDRLGFIYEIRSACKLDSRIYYSTGLSTVWAPTDFGAARMAALGWRLTLADQIVKKGSDKVVAEFREKSRKTPSNLRDAWDWFYLCSVRNDNAAAYEAAEKLSRAAPTDPLALWALLHTVGARTAALGQRYYVISSNDANDHEPPLPQDQLDHLLAAFQALKTRRPELVQAEVLANLTTELKRAKRVQEGDAIYKAAIASALQLPQIAGVFDLAAERGDVDALLLLADRYERLTTGRANSYHYTGTFYFFGPGLALSHGMSVSADKKAGGDVIRLLDGALDQLARKIERQTPSAARSARKRGAAGMGYSPQYQIWVGKQSRYMRITFPRANEFIDSTTIQVIRTAFEIYKRDDLLSDLLAHLEKQADGAKSPQTTLVARLARSAIFWWNDDKDQAIEEFAKVALAAPLESELRLDLAELLEQKGERADALAALDSVQPYDTQTLQRKEEIALRIAVSTGGIDRARAAAERLFGLRLDNEAQVKLAGQMGQLGLGELAESVLARARRRAGNKASVLMGLMVQYQKQGKVDAALQIAAQILRSSTAVRQTNPNYYNPDDPDQARAAAIGVLNRSGKLPELIARALDQVKKTPTAIQPHQALADYYKAAGDKKKTAEQLAAIVALRPDDANLRYQVAQQLSQDNQHDQAVEHYKIVFQKDPVLLMRGWYQILTTFQAAKKTEEFLDLLEKADLRQLGQPYMVTNMLGNLNEPKLASRVIGLFRKAWEAFPEYRQYMLEYMYGDAFWQAPEVYDYLREAVVPRKATFASAQQWYQLTAMIYNSGMGPARTMLNRLMEMAEARGRLDDLATEVEAARKEIPAWTAGDVVLSLIRLRQERYSEAQPAIDRYLKENKDDASFTTVCGVIGDELERHGETRGQAVGVYEKAIAVDTDDVRSYRDDALSPSTRLVNIYKNDNRPEDARRLLLRIADQEAPTGYNEDYAAQMRMQKVANSASQLRDLGYPADSAALYGKALEIVRGISPDTPYWYGGDRESLKTQYEQGLDASIEELNPADLTDRLAQGLADQPKSQDKPKTKPAKGDGLVDASMILNPRDIDRVAIKSLLEEGLAAGAKGNPKEWAKLTDLLESAQAKHPEDLSVAVAMALSALDGQDAAKVAPALKRLLEVADKSGLEPLSEGTRANARQRSAAAKLLPLWLVARSAWKHKDGAKYQDLADRLAEIAVEAARRQSDNLMLLAMHRERGALALKAGDQARALAAWSRMLEAIMPEQKPSRPSNPPAQKPAPAPAQKAAAKTNPRILTIEAFEQATAIAKLAADNGLMDLSFKAVRDSLSGGSPVIPPKTTNTRYYIRNPNQEGPADPVAGRVESALAKVEDLWSKKHAPADRVYEALRAVVLPADRPTEIFLYAPPISMQSVDRPQSVARRLAEAAARAGRLDELEKIANARQGPAAVLPRDIMIALCALASHDPARSLKALTDLQDRHKNEAARTTADLLCHVALPAYFEGSGALKAKALELIAGAEKSLEGANQAEPAGTIMLRVARDQLDHGDAAAGRKRLEAFLEMKDRTRPNYSGDYGFYLRRQELEQVAELFARIGHWADALEVLGRMADITVTSNYGRSNRGLATARTLELLEAVQPAERYQALLDWSMPKDTRKSIRLLVAPTMPQSPPALFVPESAGAVARNDDPASSDRLSTASALIAAARDCGKLDELAQRVQALAAAKDAQKVENAEDLLIMVEAARGQVAKVAKTLEDRGAQLSKENDEAVARLLPVEWNGRHALRTTAIRPQGGATPAPTSAAPPTLEFPPTTWLVDQSLLRGSDPKGRELGRRLAQALMDRARLGQGMSSATIKTELLRETASRSGRLDLVSLGGLASWREAPQAEGRFGASSPQSGWISHEGHIARPFGSAGDVLYLGVPLTGEYEFSVEMITGLAESGSIALHGLSVSPPPHFGPANVSELGWEKAFYSQGDQDRGGGSHRFLVKATPERTRYFVDGRLVYTDLEPGVGSPWLGLVAGNQERIVFRRPTITGRPIIPREVRLVDGDRLHGWATMSGETALTRPNFAANGSAYPPRPKRNARGGARPVAKRPTKPEDYDWTAQDGVITGKRKTARGETNRNFSNQGSTEDLGGQSALVYLRPLEDGDAVSYEFYYDPGEVVASPALGQTAYLIEEGGVKLHWITSSGSALWGVDAANRVAAPKAGKPTLKPAAWNQATLRLDGGRVKIELNGQPVVDRPIEPGQGRNFGLYHDKTTSEARVRNVVLKGRWPLAFPAEALADLTALSPTAPQTDSARTLRHDLIGEDVLALSAESILAEAQSRPALERYQKLVQWVLPSPDHPRIRLAGAFTPSYPAPTKSESPGPPRRQSGGELVAPVLAMVETAKEIGKLGELQKQVAQGHAADDPAALALLTLIDLAQGDDSGATSKLKRLASLIGKESPRGPEYDRWRGLVATAKAVERPAPRADALAVLKIAADHAAQRAKTYDLSRAPDHAWPRQIAHLIARAEDEPKLENQAPASAPWATATRTAAFTRGGGFPVAHWRQTGDTITHLPGHDFDFLYLNTPLKGDFQLDCEITAAVGREIHVMFAGVCYGLSADAASLDRSRYGDFLPPQAIMPPLDKKSEWHALKLVVRDKRMTLSIDGRKLTTASAPDDRDPWIALFSEALGASSVRKPAITGKPQVSESLALSKRPDLDGWDSDEYGEFTLGDAAGWRKAGDEIKGRLHDNLPLGFRLESTLRHHRPLLEDDRVTYEFFYEPGMTMVHPALGRQVFLIEPEGLKIHWLTDGAFERTGLAPDNSHDEPDHRRGPASPPLKPKAWNTLAMAVKGDTVSITLNGQLIHEGPIAPSNARTFAFFHYAEAVDARIRGVTLEGNWPRQPPQSLLGAKP